MSLNMRGTARPKVEGGYYIKYDDPVTGYVDFILKNKRYSKVKSYKTVEEQIRAIAAAGWAVDPHYASVHNSNIKKKRYTLPKKETVDVDKESLDGTKKKTVNVDKGSFGGSEKKTVVVEKGALDGTKKKTANVDKGSFGGSEKKTVVVEKGSLDGTKKKMVDVDKESLDVTITLPVSLFENQNVDEVVANAVKEGITATKNADESVTFKMSKEKHKEMMEVVKSNVIKAIDSLKSGIDFKSIKDITNNNDFSEFTLIVDKGAYENSLDGLAVLGLGISGMIYELFNGVKPEKNKVTIFIKDKATEKVFDQIVYPDA